MKKRYRLIIVLAVIGVCFLFLWPSLQWYFIISPEQKILAMKTREQIKENAEQAAEMEFERLFEIAKEYGDLPEDFDYLLIEAKKLYNLEKKKLQEKWDAFTVLNAFPNEDSVKAIIEGKYRDEILSLKELQKNAIQLGLDLSGGLSIVLKADRKALEEKLEHPLTEDDLSSAMQGALEDLNTRIDNFGLTEPVIRQQGSDQIYVEIPGNADPQRILDIIMDKGSLTFHIVDREQSNKFQEYYSKNRTSTFDEKGEVRKVDDYGELIDPPIVSSDVIIRGVYQKDRYGLDELIENPDGTYRYLALKKNVGLDGNYIIHASVSRDHIDGKPQVNFRLNSDGAEIFRELTAANVNESLAIVLNDHIKAYPTIIQALSDSGQITGFDLEGANNIALILKTASQDVKLEVESQESIGPSMGEDTIRQGMYALLGGVVAVFIFMLMYYKISGINAVFAQLINFFMMFSILSAFNFTLTLPSIAGFILTIGMAVDASVIIFERMKEEMHLGKTRKAVIEAGFNKAFWAVMDSNITTFIAALFLSQLGSGPIQGFAITLAVGVFSSVFTALFVSRLIFDFSTDVFRSKKVSITWAKIGVQPEIAGGKK